MKKDYHMHPNLLKKPEQAEQFINQAVSLGFDELCFTDHMPFSVTGDESDRIPQGKIGEYCEKIHELADRYKDKIAIKCGIEIDYHPSCLAEIESVISAGSFDYIIGSSHIYCSGFKIPLKETTYSEFAEMNFKNYLSAAKSGYFDTISHLDVHRWVFYWPDCLIPDDYTPYSCAETLNELFSVLEKNHINLEANASALYKNFDKLGFYPENRILEMAKKYNLNMIYGSDAHIADKVGYGYDEVVKTIKDYGFTLK